MYKIGAADSEQPTLYLFLSFFSADYGEVATTYPVLVED